MDCSPLDRLPAEVRNEIWILAVTKQGRRWLGWSTGTHREHEPPITQVCREIRSETHDMYYANNDFVVVVGWRGAKPIYNWLENIGWESCAAIRHLEIVGALDEALLLALGVQSYTLRSDGLEDRVVAERRRNAADRG